MNRVENQLEDLRLHRGTLFPIVTRLRAMALASGPAITEEVKYGGILFASRTGFCGVFAYTNHVTLEFGDGSTLPDRMAFWRARENFVVISESTVNTTLRPKR